MMGGGGTVKNIIQVVKKKYDGGIFREGAAPILENNSHRGGTRTFDTL